VSRPLVHLVDDDDAVRTSVARLLRLGDYDVREYASGLALIDAADGLDEGCILIDFNMPGANGAEVVRTLRDRAVDLPVIIMTGATTPSVTSPEPGIVGFIQKPFRRGGIGGAAGSGSEASVNQAVSEFVRPASRLSSLRRQKFALLATFLAIICVSGFAFYTSPQLIASASRAERTETLLVEIGDLLSALKDVETGSRGYALSNDDPRHLRRMELGIAATEASIARLRRLVSQPDLRRSFEALFKLAQQRIEFSRRLVAERQDSVKTSRNLQNGLMLMDRIRDQIAVIRAVQERHYQAERRTLERQAWVAGIAVAAGIALSLTIIAWLFALRGSELERQRQLEEDLRALNLELDGRVKESTLELRRASNLIQAVVENLPDMIFLKDAANEFRYVLINKAGETLLGRERAEIIGRTDTELLPPAQAEQFLRDSQEATTSGRPRAFPDRALTNATGTRIVESRKVPIPGEDGGHLVLGIVRDVTDARATEAQLSQLQRMDAVGQLTGGVAHDFNNLLAIIQGNSEVLREHLEGDLEGIEMVDDVMSAADRGAELVRRLLAFARKQRLAPETVDLAARLPNVFRLLERSLGETVNLQIKTAPDLWPATVDPTQFDDAIVNLAINARDAMPSGGTLTISTQNVTLDEEYTAAYVDVAPGDYVMLAISDTGTGMAPDVVARAFEPFFTTKSEGKGTGLGLSQVFGWVKQSGGHIKIYSELGHGTTFKLYLPRAKSLSPAANQRAEPAMQKGDETILVVEDNPSVRKAVIRQLHDLGYRTIEAESGAAALRIVRDGASFDMVLTDVIMPGGLTGYQLVDELRLSDPDLKVLFTSGYTELAAPPDRPASKDPLLSKPYRKQDLGRAVRAVLD